MTQNKSTYRAPALEKALDIIELLAHSKQPLTKKEISLSLDKTVNEIFRMLEVLRDREYVSLHEAHGTYELSLKLFELSSNHLPIKRLLRVANSELLELCESAQQSCHLCVYDRENLLVVSKQESPYKMGFGLRLGARVDIFGSGSGVVLLAFSDDETRTKILNNSGSTEDEKKYLYKEVARTTEKGFYVGKSPQIDGLINISMPIFTLSGGVAAILTIPYLSLNASALHHNIVDIEQATNFAKQSAKRLTASMGGTWHLPDD